MTMKKADLRQKRIAELEALDRIRDRIDQVASDLSTGKHRYAVIDASTLGALLGVHFADAGSGDWQHVYFAYDAKPEDGCDVFPFAENVSLLDGEVSDKRHQALAKRAEALTAEGHGADLTLSKNEEQMLREAYQRQHGGGGCVTLAVMSVHSTAGVELCFEGTLSDGYPDGGAWSPYDRAKGRGFDSSGLVLADD